MSYDQDPARWSTDPDEAPELLRGAFSAGRNEGPSRTQMRSLAVKLAAASAGGAVAVGTVKAASAGNTLTTAATWSAAKVASVVVLAGSVVTGAMIWRSSSPDDAQHGRGRSRVQAPVRSGDDPQENAPPVETAEQALPSGAAVAAPVVTTAPTSPEVVVTPVGAAPATQPGAATAVTVESVPQARATQLPSAGTTSAAPAARTSADKISARSVSPESTAPRASAKPAERASSASASARSSNARTARVSSTSSAELPPPSEISLLRSAQVALQSRPREAFQLTQQHRRLYPAGEFAQERDALAIQALMRAGETDQARELAQAFIRAYPTSPHAHRFREAMGIR